MTAGSRILIIIFSLAIVILGFQPLKHQYGSFGNTISEYSNKLFGEGIDFSGFNLPEQISIEVGEPNGETFSKGIERKKKELKRVEAFDKINPEDRNALENLLDKLNE